MGIIYVSSMDQYGPSSGGRVDGGLGTSSFTMTNDIMLGDGFTALPAFTLVSDRWRPLGQYEIKAPAWGARQGDYALVANGLTVIDDSGFGSTALQSRLSDMGIRWAFQGATSTTRYMHVAFSTDVLPSARGGGYICDFCDTNGEIRASLRVNTAGRLELVDGQTLQASQGASGYSQEPNVLLISSAPVIAPNTWYSLNFRIVANPTDATIDFDCYVGDISAGNLVLTGTGLAATSQTTQPAGVLNNIDVLSWLPATLVQEDTDVADQSERAIRDIVQYDTSGTYNNTFLGQVFVSAQEMRTEDAGSDWTFSPRDDIEDGVLNTTVNQTGIRLPDNADFTIGTADFTFETRIRFGEIPTGIGATAIILDKWAGPSDQSYRLYYDADSAGLIWEVTTDGSTPIQVKSIPWAPLVDTWYSLALVRETAETSIYIDGIEIGGPVADSNSYFDGAASLGIAAGFGTGSTPDTATAFNGFLDEVRFTIGVGRYSTNYTPATTAFGRDLGSDAQFNSVELLMGFDGGVIDDESSNARTLTINASPVTADTPGDGDFSFEVLNQRPAWDDTFIEGAYLFADGVFTFTGQPAAAETITVGSQTYTYRTSFTGAPANEIIIGVDVATTISNTIAAINGGAGEGTVYGTGTTANTSATALEIVSPQFGLRAITIGAAGNSIATTETVANGSFDNATLTGGQDLPADADFAIERLPIETSGVLAVQATVRAYKTDAGAADLRLDLVGPSAGVGAGTALPIDLNPAWFRQVHEEDPDTASGLTPSTIIGGRLRFNRTA